MGGNRWPKPDSTRAEWLAALPDADVIVTAEVVAAIGASLPTVNKLIHHPDIPDTAVPNRVVAIPGGTSHGWTPGAARAFVRWAAQQAQLPDAFDRPMMTAAQAAERLGLSAGSFRNAVYQGRVPGPAIPARGQTGALWDAAEIENVAFPAGMRTTAEVADELGVPARDLLRLIERGVVTPKQHGPHWAWSAANVTAARRALL